MWRPWPGGGPLRRAVVLGTPLLVVAVCLIFWPVTLVRVQLPKADGQLIAAQRVTDGETICLKYRHSVELIRVEGCFRPASRGGFEAVETRMESVGTGLPNAAPGRTTLKDGWIVVDEQFRPVEVIRFFIVPINQTRLTIAGQFLALERLPSGTLVQVAADRVSVWRWLSAKLRTHFSTRRIQA